MESDPCEKLLLKPSKISQEFWLLFRSHPRDFYYIYLLEFFIELPFTLIISGSTIYNIDIQKFTEIQAGIIFAFIGLFVGICAICFSNFPARYGIKPSLLTGNILGFVTNLLLYYDQNRFFQVAVMFLLYIPSISLNFISLKLAVKQYTYPETRSLGYSLFYMVFFIAAGISAAIIDVLLTNYGIVYTPFGYIFIFNVFLYGLSIFLTYIIRDIDIENIRNNQPPIISPQNGWEYTKEVIGTTHFWKFFSLMLLLSVVKSMYFHLSATLPQYMYRNISKGAHFGYMMAGHQLVLIISTPLLTALVYHYKSYTLLLIGSFITSFSVLIFVFGSNYFTIAIFVVVISFGEAIYAPRLIDFTLEVAPKGKEAIYIGIANVPNFLSLMVTGVSSGVLLHYYCPENGISQECVSLWFWIGGYSFVACISMVLLKGFFEKIVQIKNKI